MGWFRFAVATTIATTAIACSLASLGDFNKGAPAAADGGDGQAAGPSADGAGAFDAAADSLAPPPPPPPPREGGIVSIIPNGDFESPGLGCGPGWDVQNATIERVPGELGGQACKVCKVNGSASFLSTPVAMKSGQYGVQFRYKVELTGGSPDFGLDLLVEAYDPNDEKRSQMLRDATDWVTATTYYDAAATGSSTIQTGFTAFLDKAICVTIDDVILTGPP